MQAYVFLNVAVKQLVISFPLVLAKYHMILIWKDTLPILDLGLDIVSGIGCLYIEIAGLGNQAFGQRSAYHHQSYRKKEVLVLCGICTQAMFAHLQATCLQRSSDAGLHAIAKVHQSTVLILSECCKVTTQCQMLRHRK